MTVLNPSTVARVAGVGVTGQTQKSGLNVQSTKSNAVDQPSRAHALGVLPDERPVTGRPDDQERERLVRTLGAALRGLRTEYGLGTRRLAVRAATSRSTVVRLEHGERRPRRSLLSSIALGLNPDRHLELLEVLVAAAGPSVRPESSRSVRARRRRIEAGILAGTVPLPSKLAVPLALHRRADAARREAMQITERPGWLDDDAAVKRAGELLQLSRELSDQAGPAIVFYVGGQEIRAGFG